MPYLVSFEFGGQLVVQKVVTNAQAMKITSGPEQTVTISNFAKLGAEVPVPSSDLCFNQLREDWVEPLNTYGELNGWVIEYMLE